MLKENGSSNELRLNIPLSMHWDKLSHAEIKKTVFDAINTNSNYRIDQILGIPATYLDSEEFYPGAPFLEDAPFLSAFIANPNHIGCHTIEGSQSEFVFHGTQTIEKDLIEMCAEELFNGKEGEQDGYVATGGTEGNIEAIWIYRNYFRDELNAKLDQIAIIHSEDTHYSIPKAADLLNLSSVIIKVDEVSREVDLVHLKDQIKKAQLNGFTCFIVIVNMATTMFGSVDDVDGITQVLKEEGISFKIHVDAAFGGFIYPFSNPNNRLNFSNPHISSIVLDGHKMLQAPYGTGVFLIRKGMMKYVGTKEAKYVLGGDYTLCGSRSGANAIALWMILKIHGSDGWKVKIGQILDRTNRLCSNLDELGIEYYRNPHLNIVTIKSGFISKNIARKYYLVPDNHKGKPKWWKIVMMTHVKNGVLDTFIMDLRSQKRLELE